MLSLLAGITRPSPSTPPVNPAFHGPLSFQNRMILEKVTPEGVQQRVEHVGNVLCTWGLNHLTEELVKGSTGFATDWVNRFVVATGTDVITSGDDALTGSTGVVVLGAGSMVASDGGARTLQYNMTITDTDNAYTIGSAGLFGSTADTASAVAMAVAGATVGKETNATINATYQVIAGTAA